MTPWRRCCPPRHRYRSCQTRKKTAVWSRDAWFSSSLLLRCMRYLTSIAQNFPAAQVFFPRNLGRKSQAFIAHKFSPFILSNFNMTIWPPSIPLVGSLRFPLLCSSCPLQFPPFSHVSHTAYADSPISRKQARKATSLLIYPSIFRG